MGDIPMNCFLCKVWFWIGRVTSQLAYFEYAPEWFVDPWYRIYNHSMGKSLYYNDLSDCGDWLEGEKDE